MNKEENKMKMKFQSSVIRFEDEGIEVSIGHNSDMSYDEARKKACKMIAEDVLRTQNQTPELEPGFWFDGTYIFWGQKIRGKEEAETKIKSILNQLESSSNMIVTTVSVSRRQMTGMKNGFVGSVDIDMKTC